MRSEVSTLPPEFLERLRSIFPSHEWDALVNTFTTPKPTTFRTNTLKVTPSSVREQLETEGLQLEPVSWYQDAFILRSGRLRALQEMSCYQQGEIYVQSLSSMLPPLVLDPHPNDSVLDLAAAPGGKTTQLACLMHGQGRLVANDNNRIRFYKLRANAIQQGVPDVELSLRDGEAFGKSHPNAFDRVLVDAPCSTEGRFLVHEPTSFRYWRPDKIHEMASKQRRLLRAGAQALRPGGVLVYATCTFAPEENEGVVDWMLTHADDVLELEPISLPLPNTMPGLRIWDRRSFHPSLRHTIRILPTPEMEGFFLATLRKRSSTQAH